MDHRLRSRNEELWWDFLTCHDKLAYVDFQWIDFSGILRMRTVPVSRCNKLASQHLPLRAGCFSMIGLALDGVFSLPERYVTGSCDGMYPDWTSLRMLNTSHASVLCFVSEEPLPLVDGPTAPSYTRCPRTVLANIIEDVAEKQALSFLVGFELEFYLIRDELWQKDGTIDSEHFSRQYSFWSTVAAVQDGRGTCLMACVDALQAANVVVEQFHAEYGEDQYEISLGPLPALAAVDTLIQALRITKATAVRHGFRAVFFPYPIKDMMPSGLHIHLSVHNRSGAPVVAAQADSFLAGVLKRLPVLVALAMPVSESYRQIDLPAEVSDWVAWGTENRNAPVRRITHTHWEFRLVDATANIYLALGGYISAGTLGIRAQEKLNWKDCRTLIHRLTDEARKDLGIVKRVPKSVEEAMTVLRADSIGLDKFFGTEILEYYNWVKDQELKFLAGKTTTEKLSLLLTHF